MLQKSSGKLHHTTTSANRETESIFFFSNVSGLLQDPAFPTAFKAKKN